MKRLPVLATMASLFRSNTVDMNYFIARGYFFYNFIVISTLIRTPGDLCKPLGTVSTPMKGDTYIFDLTVRNEFIEVTTTYGLKKQHRTIFLLLLQKTIFKIKTGYKIGS